MGNHIQYGEIYFHDSDVENVISLNKPIERNVNLVEPIDLLQTRDNYSNEITNAIKIQSRRL